MCDGGYDPAPGNSMTFNCSSTGKNLTDTPFCKKRCDLNETWGANVDTRTCGGKTVLKDGESCTIACNSSYSDPFDGATSYTYACNDTTGSGNLMRPTYACYDRMCFLNLSPLPA